MQEPAHKFPWAGIKGQILHILAGLLQPPPGRSSPGNPDVQAQIIRHNGIVSLLNCCVYDDHNRYARERVQICLKWLMDGSDAANNFLRELVAMSPPPNLRPPPANGPESQPSEPGPVQTLRIDGIAGEVKVRVKATATPPPQQTGGGPSNLGLALPSLASSTAFIGDDIRSAANNTLPPIQSPAASPAATQSARMRSEELLQDIITLADEAARLAIGRKPDADETEEEDFM
jgi:hypothetical protein